MNLKKLVKMLEAETDMEKAAEVLQKIDSLIIRKGVLRMGPFGYLHPLELESHICKRDAFEKDYFDYDIDADARAMAAAEKMFSKPVEPVMIPNIAADGGLHCISWDMSY